MAKADITAERLRELFDYDPETGIFMRKLGAAKGVDPRYLNKPAGSINKVYGYVIMGVDRKLFLAHRLAWLYVHGKWPEQHIDHINGIRHDNRIDNLRDASPAINAQNQRRAPKGKATNAPLGAHWKKHCKLWAANIQTDGKLMYLGYFKTAEDAHQAYLVAKRRLHEGCTI